MVSLKHAKIQCSSMQVYAEVYLIYLSRFQRRGSGTEKTLFLVATSLASLTGGTHQLGLPGSGRLITIEAVLQVPRTQTA